MKYEEYKDSGVEWMGIVPSHWVVCKIKHKYQFKTGATPSSGKKEFYDGELKWANISDINGSTIYDTAKHITEEAVKSCSMTISPKGSLLYSFKLSVGQVAFCGDDMYTNEAIATFESKNQNLRYLYYIAPQFIIHNANRNIYNAPLLNQDLIKNAIIVLPPIEEQNKIVTYLDKKCEEIDRAIDTQKKKIELLNELKQTIITNAVTKGLNPDAPMKDSGAEWIGEIPQHWDMVKIKFNFNIYAGATPKTEVQNYWDGDIVWITPADYKTKDKYISCGQRYISKDGYNSCNTQLVPKGSLIFSKRAPIGTVALADTELCTNQGCLSCVPRKCSSLYYYYVTSVYTEIFDLFGSGATFKEISANDFANIKLPSPSYEEQLAIVSSIEKEVSKIDKQISKTNRHIELLNELKQSIITEAVTGKIKVC